MITLICSALLLVAFLTRDRPRHRPMADAVRLNPQLARKGW